MCDYSLHAVASRPAKAGETLITTTFRGTGTRGFAAEAEPAGLRAPHHSGAERGLRPPATPHDRRLAAR